MPRTERGRATCKRSDWEYSGRVPVVESERLDARFRNATSKPPRKGKGKVGPATGIARSNLKPDKSVFERNKPAFDRGRFKTGHRLDYTDYRLDDYGERGDGRLTKNLKTRDTNTGANVPAVCDGASCGEDENAEITARYYGRTSFERLLAEARRPLNLVRERLFVAAIVKLRLLRPKKVIRNGRTVIQHFLFVCANRRLLKHIGRGWFGEGWPWRWDRAAGAYLDVVRIGGKATTGIDVTWGQAAKRIDDDAIDHLSTRPDAKHEGDE
jgi:hypothetical protein